MNKKLIAVAVGSAIGAIAAPAFAQSSTVTLSGNLNYQYGYYDNGGAGFATAAGAVAGVAKVRHDGMINSESEWVLAGEENLGGGMAAYFRCASTFDIVGASASNICGRTSYVGLKGNFGSISFGNNDTPSKRQIALYDPFPISAPHGQGAQMFNATASATANGATPASFSRRQNNLITYDMKTMNGFDAALAYTSTNEATASTSATTVQKPRMWSAMVNYTNGPFMIGGSYESHTDYNPGAVATYRGGKDRAYQFGVAYTFMGSFKVSAIYNNMRYDNINGLGADMNVATYGLYGDWAISGPHKLRLGYGNQGATKGSYNAAALGGACNANDGAGNTGSQKMVVEYGYALSKRTEVSGAYARIANDRSSNITIGTGSNTPNYGETQTYLGMRLNHKF